MTIDKSAIVGVGVRVGPLLFPFVGDDPTYRYDLGGLNKVVPIAVASIQQPITIRAWRCSDGTGLRFLTSLPAGVRVPLSTAQLESMGEESLEIPVFSELPPSGRLGFGAYWLFTQPGPYQVEVSDPQGQLGSFIVRAIPRGATTASPETAS